MRIARLSLMAITVVMLSLVITADSVTRPGNCGPGSAPELCTPGGPSLVLASASPSKTDPGAAVFSPPRSRHSEAHALAASFVEPPSGSLGGTTEPFSLLLLGTLFVLAAWTLRHVKAG